MKHSFLRISLLILSFSTFAVSCKKDGGDDTTAPGPDVLLVTEGLLCTMGEKYQDLLSGRLDTLVYFRPNSTKDLTEYGLDFISTYRPVSLSVNSNGTVSIKLKTPYTNQNIPYYYFSITPTNPSAALFPQNPYQYGSLRADKKDDTEFIVKRDGINNTHFTIESKKYPGNYLSIARWANAGTVGEQWFVFTTKRHKWFFMPD